MKFLFSDYIHYEKHYIKIMNTADIREDFIAYFRKEKHKFLNPSKVFNDDPTLFFVNAGMNQLKQIFLGKKEFDEKYSKLVNCQTCIRAGGKHNDFDDVGKDTYHLTSFGMLGNWSLNNYWKEEAIKLAFDYLVNKCKFDKNRMYATYFGGNHEISEDTESKEIWKKYLPESHIVAGSFKDNFWMMGDTGPCGACTEIHYDLKDRTDVAHLVNMSDPTLIEVWNLVFMEYNAVQIKSTSAKIIRSVDESDGTKNTDIIDAKEITTTHYTKLEKRFVDTGMGLERLAMIMQNKMSLYQIDIFKKLIYYAQIVSSGKEYTDDYCLDNKKDIAFRIFADHIRTCVVAIFDGAIFDCNGKGFILRKIFRRLLMYYYIHLNDCNVELLTKHHIFPAIITEVLNFHLLKKHDAIQITKIFHDEEVLYVGKICKVKYMYDARVKKGETPEEAIRSLLEKGDKIRSTMGVDDDIVRNFDKMKIGVF